MDILIVGAGPTGLMMACQLLRFGINFRIIDKGRSKTQESKAIGIQSKTMEIFQNLGIVDEFLKKAKTPKEASFFSNKKLKFTLHLPKTTIKGVPFPKIFLVPQSETEEILSNYLQKHYIHIERETELMTFIQTQDGIEAEIKNYATDKNEKIRCRYIIGCDGAKSTVREIMNIPFEGGSYQQEFILADVALQWKYSKDNFALFISKKGLLVNIPLEENYSRLMICPIDSNLEKNEPPPTKNELEKFIRDVMELDIDLDQPIWTSRFHLHHRAVTQYQKGFAFLAGDAAHIHSPVGAQGMNTGLQDVTNLAWKLALVLKYGGNKQLLDTYQTERIRIGKKLLSTTDRLFGFLTSNNPFIIFIKQHIFPNILCLLSKSEKLRKKFFCFMSELAIHYHKSDFISECVEGADDYFLSGPQAGWRAPDYSFSNTTLFEKLRDKPFNILLFQNDSTDKNSQDTLHKIENFIPGVLAIHRFVKSEDYQMLFDSYGIKKTGIYFIRPDGYIGFRAYGDKYEELLKFIINLFRHDA